MPSIIRVFDCAMCCSTGGACCPVVDLDLAWFAADRDWLQKQRCRALPEQKALIR
jgi:hypothetical protein